MEENKFVIRYIQFSPIIVGQKETNERMGYLKRITSKFEQLGVGVIGTYDVNLKGFHNTLNGAFKPKTFLTNADLYVVVVSTHGLRGKGDFEMDGTAWENWKNLRANEFVSGKDFWGGLRCGDNVTFGGFQYLLPRVEEVVSEMRRLKMSDEEIPKIILIAAQCYGRQFIKEMEEARKNYVVQNKVELVPIVLEGISSGPTYSKGHSRSCEKESNRMNDNLPYNAEKLMKGESGELLSQERIGKHSVQSSHLAKVAYGDADHQLIEYVFETVMKMIPKMENK